MKRLGLFVMGGLLALSMVGLASAPKQPVHAEGTAEASNELIKMVDPTQVWKNATMKIEADQNRLNYPWEYLTVNYPETETKVKDVAYLEFQFYNEETFVEGKEYASYMTDVEGFLPFDTIVETLKKANYPEESDVGIAIRYVAKEGSGYANSDFYVQEGLRHTFHMNYADESLYDVYAFGPAACGWAMNEEYRLSYHADTHIYSLEKELLPNSMVKVFITDKANNTYAQYDTACESMVTKEAGMYRLEFSFRHPTGAGFVEDINRADPENLNGWIRLTKLSEIEEGETVVSGNLLSNKLVYSSELPHDKPDGISTETWRKCYTDGNKNSGYQMAARDVKAWYMWDLGDVYSLSGFGVWWEASCADEYDIYLSDTVAHPEDLEQYNGKFDLLEEKVWKKAASVVASEPNKTHDDQVTLPQNMTGRYVLLQTTKQSDFAKGYGYQLFEFEAYAATYDTSFVGAQFGTSAQGNAIRFIGKVQADPATFAHEVKMELSFTNGAVSYGPKAVTMDYFYKTLTTTLNGVSNTKLTAEEGYYFFSFTLTNVKDGTYTISVLEDGEWCGGATYTLANGSLSRA